MGELVIQTHYQGMIVHAEGLTGVAEGGSRSEFGSPPQHTQPLLNLARAGNSSCCDERVAASSARFNQEQAHSTLGEDYRTRKVCCCLGDLRLKLTLCCATPSFRQAEAGR